MEAWCALPLTVAHSMPPLCKGRCPAGAEGLKTQCAPLLPVGRLKPSPRGERCRACEADEVAAFSALLLSLCHLKSPHAPCKECGRYFFDPPKKYPKKCPLVSEAADPSAQGPYSGSLGISAQRWARLSARCPSGGAPTWLLPVPPLPAPPQSTIAARFIRRAGF